MGLMAQEGLYVLRSENHWLTWVKLKRLV